MAKMMASSLLRTHWTGEIVVFHNSDEPLFKVERAGLREIRLEVPMIDDPELLTSIGWSMKYKVRDIVHSICRDAEHANILFVDCDCLALRNVDLLVEGNEWDIRYYAEPGNKVQGNVFNCYLDDCEMKQVIGRSSQSNCDTTYGWAPRPLRMDGINSGTWAVRSSLYLEVMKTWEGITNGVSTQKSTLFQFWEQSAWNRLILNCGSSISPCGATSEITKLPWLTEKFERGLIQRPMHGDPLWQDYTEGSLLHFFGADNRAKIQCMYGMYMSTFFWEESSTFLQFIES